MTDNLSLNTSTDVSTFMNACGQHTVNCFNDFDHVCEPQADLYFKLCSEEFNELVHAYVDGDIVEVADAIGDLIWVLQGLAYSVGIPLQPVWDEIARSNMSKVMPDGTVHKRADGKIQKPATYSPPNIEQFFDQQ